MEFVQCKDVLGFKVSQLQDEHEYGFEARFLEEGMVWAWQAEAAGDE